MKLTRVQFIGLFLFVVSTLGGLIGTFYGIYSSLAGLDAAESAGIGAVGDGIQNALISSAAGFIGSILGILLLVIGTIKRSKSTSNQ